MGNENRDLNRRAFLAGGAGAALASALSQKADAAPSDAEGEWRNKQEGMAYRRLGRTNFMVSEIVMGGVQITPERWEHILPAVDRGLNYLDTSSNYGRGRSERAFAKVIQARGRDSFFLCTKVNIWAHNRNRLYEEIFQSLPASEQKKLKRRAQEEIEKRRSAERENICHYLSSQEERLRASALSNVMAEKYGDRIDRDKHYRKTIFTSVEESLERLGTDYVDVITCPHGANTPYEVSRHPEIFEAFEELKKQGKARHLSVSAHTDSAGVLEAAAETKAYSMAMVASNIVNRRYVDPALETARKADLGVIAMKVARPVFNGRGDGREDPPEWVKLIQDAVPGSLKVPQKAYLWALRNPAVGAAVSDMTNLEMVDDNLPLAGSKERAA